MENIDYLTAAKPRRHLKINMLEETFANVAAY